MKRVVLFVLGVVAIAPCARAQTPDEAIERALAPAPRQLKEGATVIKWKADNTYDTLRKGTNKLVCYDRSGDPGQQPFAVQCTSLANLDRVAQNRKFEAIADKAATQAAIDAAEKDGTRVEAGIRFGVADDEWTGPRACAHPYHRRCPGRDRADDGPARQQPAGRHLDHERGHVDRSSHDSRQLRSRKVEVWSSKSASNFRLPTSDFVAAQLIRAADRSRAAFLALNCIEHVATLGVIA